MHRSKSVALGIVSLLIMAIACSSSAQEPTAVPVSPEAPDRLIEELFEGSILERGHPDGSHMTGPLFG